MQTILYEVSNNIATITFNRPTAMNALNPQMADELARVTEQTLLDKSIRAVLIKGAGELFMAGGDIRFFYDTLDTMPAEVLPVVRKVNASILNLIGMPKPVIACVHGSVAGIGLSFMLAADLVIAAEGTQFTTAYSKIGLTPDGGLSYTLPRLVGVKKAMELLLLANVFDANKAYELGLVNHLATQDTVFSEGDRLIQQLAQGPTNSYAKMKQLVHSSMTAGLAAQLEAEAHAFVAATVTEDFREGVAAFVTKAKPQFKGR